MTLRRDRCLIEVDEVERGVHFWIFPEQSNQNHLILFLYAILFLLFCNNRKESPNKDIRDSRRPENYKYNRS